jgi:hypothetical protein
MGSLLGDGENRAFFAAVGIKGETQTHFFCPYQDTGATPNFFFAVARIRTEPQTIFCCCRNMGETPHYLLPLLECRC